MPTERTARKRGYQYQDLLKYIRWILERDPPKDPTAPVVIKFCIDGATMTSGKRVQQEVVAFNLLYSDFTEDQVSIFNIQQTE